MNVLLVGCCKNIADNIDIIKKNFYNLSKYVNICKGVYYENNSHDNTADLLKLWEKNDSNIVCICEKYTDKELLNMCKAITWDNKPCRIEIIAMARNKILNEIEKKDYDNINYVIMYDMDHKNLLPINKIVEILYNNKDFDALICNGTDQKGAIYDTYSYRDHNYPYGPEILGNDFGYFDILKQLEFQNKKGLVPVLSAFNGLCIFKKSSIKNIRYSAHPSNELNNLYKNFLCNDNVFQKNKTDVLKFEEYMNSNCNIKLLKSLNDIYDSIDRNKIKIVTHNEGTLLGSYLFEKEDGIFYKNCSGYNYPIVCEHVTFFLEMREKGFDKIYLDTNFIWSSVWYDGIKELDS
jgi:hypothetical protein